jgi:hypothetical protein
MTKRHEDLEYIRSWFNYPGEPHVATLKDGWLLFARPRSSTYRVEYHVHYNNLIVIGDIGDAVFTWSQIVTFEWIAACHFDYFLGKCQASESGREFYQWDGDHMRAILDEHLLGEEGDGDTDDKARLDAAVEAGAHDAVHNEQEWYQWASSNYELLGDDAGEWIGRGRVPHIRARGMFEGLKLAVAQLAAASKGETQ